MYKISERCTASCHIDSKFGRAVLRLVTGSRRNYFISCGISIL